MWPIAYAIVTTVNPNASDTPSKPIPTSGNAAASTALPQPPSTSQNVPKNSANTLFVIVVLQALETQYGHGTIHRDRGRRGCRRAHRLSLAATPAVPEPA